MVNVSAAEVQYIARELFGVLIRVIDERRCIYLEHGATIEIEGYIKLRGTLGTSIDKLFGEMVGKAFRHSQKRMQEVLLGEIPSRALSMTVWDRDDSPGQLAIMMDLKLGYEVYRQLWRVGTSTD